MTETGDADFTSDTRLTRELEHLASAASGRVGICALTLRSRKQATVRADEQFPTASLIKVFVSATLFAHAAQGALDPTERITLPEGPRVLGSGLLAEMAPGLRPTLGDLAVLMHAISDNWATNLLIERLGTYAINDWIASQRLNGTRLNGPVDFAALRADQRALGVSTPKDLARFFLRVGAGEALPDEARQRYLKLLRIQKYIEPLRRHLPLDPYAEESGQPTPVRVASKTGSLAGLRCEAGWIETDQEGWGIAVFSEGLSDRRTTSDNEGVELIAEASRLVHCHWGLRKHHATGD